MASSDPLHLARDAFNELADLATELGIVTEQCIYSKLGGEFCYAACNIDPENDEIALRSQVGRLLRNTEKFCSGLVDRPTANKTRSEIEKNLQIGQGRHCLKMIEYLRKFNQANSLRDREDATGSRASGSSASDHRAAQINTLVYRILQRYVALCRCSGSGPAAADRHSAHLLLRPPVLDPETGVKIQDHFDILFASKYPTENALSNLWQEVQLIVSSGQATSGKHIAFKDENDQSATKTEPVVLKELPPEHFCDTILSRDCACLRLMLKNDALHRCSNLPRKRIVEDCASISLANTLRDFRLSARNKITLAYILAHSMYEFYDSDWMKIRWTSSNICYVKERGLKDPLSRLFAWKPHIVANFGQEKLDSVEVSGRVEEIHKFPRLRALGIMLIEIAKGEAIPADSEERTRSDGEYWIYMSTINDPNFWTNVDLEYPHYQDAVDACFNAEAFDAVYYDSELNADEKLRRRKEILDEKVVAPLRELLVSIKWMPKLTSVGPLDTWKRSPKSISKAVGASKEVNDVEESLQPKSGKRKRTQAQKDAGSWLDRMERFNDDLAKELAVSSKPIRIAILDTGCDLESIYFDDGPRPAGWKDFAASSEACNDVHGHGTFMTTLILRLAPRAQIYVARIAENEEQLRNASDSVSKAVTDGIRWASRECSADIISMSFGFSKEQLSISDAIRETLSERKGAVLFLAAPSNHGALEPERWPAKCESVISMRGANHKGDIQDYNPGRGRGESHIIGTLGVDVPSFGLGRYETEIYDSGSSVATAIASAMAGVLLQYVADKVGSNRFEEVDRKMRTYAGMRAMFDDLSTNTTKERCMFLDIARYLAGIDDVTRWARILTAMSDV